MGVLNLATPASARAFSELPEVDNMGDTPLQGYIDRAEWILSRSCDYDSTLASYTTMMTLAVHLLTENLVLKNLPSYRRSRVVNIVSERIGTYSYTRGQGSDAVYMYSNGMDDEIYAITRGFCTKGDVEVSSSHVFLRRYYVIDKSGNRYYFNENEQLGENELEDPSLPSV